MLLACLADLGVGEWRWPPWELGHTLLRSVGWRQRSDKIGLIACGEILVFLLTDALFSETL